MAPKGPANSGIFRISYFTEFFWGKKCVFGLKTRLIVWFQKFHIYRIFETHFNSVYMEYIGSKLNFHFCEKLVPALIPTWIFEFEFGMQGPTLKQKNEKFISGTNEQFWRRMPMSSQDLFTQSSNEEMCHNQFVQVKLRFLHCGVCTFQAFYILKNLPTQIYKKNL